VTELGYLKYEGPCEDPPRRAHSRVTDAIFVKIRESQTSNLLMLTCNCKVLPKRSLVCSYRVMHSSILLCQADIATYRCDKPIPVILQRRLRRPSRCR
jgi:uncharacterized protein YbaR (Trm112 family)